MIAIKHPIEYVLIPSTEEERTIIEGVIAFLVENCPRSATLHHLALLEPDTLPQSQQQLLRQIAAGEIEVGLEWSRGTRPNGSGMTDEEIEKKYPLNPPYRKESQPCE
jgi:hypothetical protein